MNELIIAFLAGNITGGITAMVLISIFRPLPNNQSDDIQEDNNQ